MIATADSQRRWRRLFLIVGAIVAAYALLAPLTSLDAEGGLVEHVVSLLDPARFQFHLTFGTR